MNILLVDDEYYNIESLEKKIEAYFDVFEHIFCAYSKEQALSYFEENVIDIMICDIEMPGGSGLELLEQIRIRNNNQTICIFLTAFARFEYASKALKLSCFDYLLKPVKDETLRLSVQRAIDERKKKSLEEENAEMATFWKEGELYLTEQLWSDVIHGNIAGSKTNVEREINLRKLDRKIVDKQYFFLMIYSMPNGDLYNHMSKELYNFTLKNILRDFFYTQEVMPVVIEAADRIYLLPIDRKLFTRTELLRKCNSAVLQFVPFYKNYFVFLLSDRPYQIEEAAEITEYMEKQIALNVVPQNKVLELKTMESGSLPDGTHHEMPVKRWENLAQQKKTGEMQLEVKSYLKTLEEDTSTNAKTLSEFYYAFMQLLHVTVSSVGKTASERFNNHLSQYSGTPYTSFGLLREWCFNVLNAYEECVRDNSDNDVIVAKVKRYIKEHLAEDMNRETLAALVYLHPDYLSHVFKNKTGTSITNYIINERINEAKRLLLKGNKSIRDIAISCGFQSVPYFSKQFKKATGVSPRDFKK